MVITIIRRSVPGFTLILIQTIDTMHWRCSPFCFLLPWILFAPLASPSRAQQTEAWLIAHDGDVFIKKQGAPWQPFAAQFDLNVGDSVRTGAESRATLLYRTGAFVTVTAHEDYGVVTARDIGAPPELVEALEWAFDRDDPETPDVLRGTIDEPPVLIYPRKGKVLLQRPPFLWMAAIPRDATYRVRVIKDLSTVLCQMDGADLWEVSATADTTLQYPANKPPLARDQRYWVEIERAHEDTFEDAGCFTVVSEETYEEHDEGLRKCKDTPGNQFEGVLAEYICAASYLSTRSFFTDALLYLELAEDEQPGEPWIQWLRNWIYEEAGLSFLIKPLEDRFVNQ